MNLESIENQLYVAARRLVIYERIMSESFLSAKTWWLFSVDKRMGYAEECQETILSGFRGA